VCGCVSAVYNVFAPKSYSYAKRGPTHNGRSNDANTERDIITLGMEWEW